MYIDYHINISCFVSFTLYKIMQHFVVPCLCYLPPLPTERLRILQGWRLRQKSRRVRGWRNRSLGILRHHMGILPPWSIFLTAVRCLAKLPGQVHRQSVDLTM